mmetsp:Transcript_66796/g.118245  ORF Transcript_66796/g.118245 Transcript_66796/m.118245 type:complete len:605 (+) Transcript_66796:44-1858(+)
MAGMASPSHAERGAMTSVPLEEHQALVQKLQRSDELIKQLKHIVKAQHGKIEEFREKLEIASIGKSPLIASYEAQDFEKAKEEKDQLRQNLYRVQAELDKVKADNRNLRKVNKRLNNMLSDTGEPSTSVALPQLQASLQSMDARPASGAQSARTPSGGSGARTFLSTPKKGGGSASDTEQGDPTLNLSETEAERSSPSRRIGKSVVPFSRTSRLTDSIPLFWRTEDPVSLMRALADVSGRILADRSVNNVTVFIVDPWLRGEVAAVKTEHTTIFYLGQGKTELQALPRSDVDSKVLPPAFTDLQDLPARSRQSLAMPVLNLNEGRIWAVLQVVLEDKKALSSNVGFVPTILQDVVTKDGGSNSGTGFNDSQIGFLRLLCGLVGGVLVHIEQLSQRQKIVDRTRAVQEAAVNVNKAKTLADFEQRVKHLFANFFSVNTIRVLFFDREQHMLLISSSQMRRKGCATIGITKGIMGQVVQKQQVIHVADIRSNPNVDPVADGLQRTGKPVASHAAMLVGPMLVDASRTDAGGQTGQDLVGIVQLLEKKRKNTINGSIQISEFSEQEQQLFQQLLFVCANAGARTIKVQMLQAQLAGTPHKLQALLSG